MLPLEATSMLGALGGIGEISKDIFGNNLGSGKTSSSTPSVSSGPRKRQNTPPAGFGSSTDGQE